MKHDEVEISRRFFIASAAGFAAGGGLLAAGAETRKTDTPDVSSKRKLRIVAINSVYQLRSHSYHIAGRFIHGYTRNGFHHQPPFELVRMWNDQHPAGDLGPISCEQHGIELCKTIAQALGEKHGLDIDGILLIIDQGDYPQNDRRQLLYPRYEIFQKIVDVFKKTGKTVPIFVDGQLSFDHQLAEKMVQTAREMKFGLMAGSALPVTWRRPEIEPTLGTPFKEGLVAFGSNSTMVDADLFHAFEVLQSMMERRKGGETGVKSIQFLEGDAVWQAGDEERWSWRLLDAALARCPSRNTGPIRENVLKPMAVLIEYADDSRGSVVNLFEQTSDFGFAATIDGWSEPLSSCFVQPAFPGSRSFDPLTYNIEKFIASGAVPYPIERTLLTSTMTDLAAQSLHQGSRVITSPALGIKYTPPKDTGFFRGPYIDSD